MGEAVNHQAGHARVSSWFLGPKAENFPTFTELITHIVTRHASRRAELYRTDASFITTDMIDHPDAVHSMRALREKLDKLITNLENHSIPFWSPRYNAHMNMDTTMSSTLGYIAAMMYNPNNVTLEASPYTTRLEQEVGTQLCEMLGYNVKHGDPTKPDGSVANLEAIWSARNLKFYPLSLRRAMKKGNPLHFLTTANTPFSVCDGSGTTKLFTSLNTWALMNLPPSEVLELPTRLAKDYGISPTFLEYALRDHSVQTIGTEVLEREYKTTEPARFFVSATRHYSWPKGGAITGMGSDRFVEVKVDQSARMDTLDLAAKLEECYQKQIPVFGVIAIMGSTEHGACDPLKRVIELRDEYKEKGLSFVVHCDAAWGGYFASTLAAPDQYMPFVPTLALKEHTISQLQYLMFADSITIDPHKSGYIHYPAGGLCYRDERTRYLITWTSPIVYHQGDGLESMGVYGVEGSKPGAAPAAVWLSHKTVPLDPTGYGRLLGEAIFTCAKFYCHLATITLGENDEEDDELIIVPFNMLPAEQNGVVAWNSAPVLQQRKWIRDSIVNRSNAELVANSDDFNRFAEIGSDLMINAFAFNFKIDGVPNRNVEEANYLNTRIFQQVSITGFHDEVDDEQHPADELQCPVNEEHKPVGKVPPLFLTESKFPTEAYGDCLKTYKERLGLGRDAVGDLTSLINVTMSPWPSDPNTLKTMADELKKIAKEQVKRCWKRNKPEPDHHGFIMQGDKTLFLIHLPMFHMENHRLQLIVEAKIPEDAMAEYRRRRAEKPNAVFTIGNTEKHHLNDLLKAGSFKVRMDEGIPTPQRPENDPRGTPMMPDPLIPPFNVTIVRQVARRSLAFHELQREYPQEMMFYMYGAGGEHHIDHMLTKWPNAQLTAECVTMDPPLQEAHLQGGVHIYVDTVFERALQPLPTTKEGQIIASTPGLNFQSGTEYPFRAYYTPTGYLITGKLTLGPRVFADWHDINMDGAHEH